MTYYNYTTIQAKNKPLQQALEVVNRAKEAHEKACIMLAGIYHRIEDGVVSSADAQKEIDAAKDKLARTAIELEEARGLLQIINNAN